MQEALTRTFPAAFLCALATFGSPAHALVLGEVEVRSALGRPLDARVPLTGVDGGALESNCFSLSREQPPGIPLLTEGTLTLERTGGSLFLRIRSAIPIYEPAIAVLVQVQCPAQVSGAALRMYSVLVDPPTGYGTPASAIEPAATLNARQGDTLQSLARKLVGGNAAARARYIASLRELNPALAVLGERDPLPEGAAVALPDLRTFANAGPAPASSPTPRERRVARASREPPREAPAPAATGVAPDIPRAASPVRVPSEAQAPQPPAPPPRPAAARSGGPGFALKLSSGEVDLSPSRRIDDRGRTQLRERQLVLDADDQVAAVLQMRNSLKLLEARVTELQLKLSSLPPSLEARTQAAAGTELARAAPSRIDVPKVDAPQAGPAKVEAPKVDTSKLDASKVESPKPDPAKVQAPPSEPARVETPVAQPAPAEAAPRATPAPAARVTPRPAPQASQGLSLWLWGLVALLVLLAMLLALRVMRRRRSEQAEYVNDEWIDIAGVPGTDEAPESGHMESPDAPVEPSPQPRRAIASDAHLATRLQENSSELRRRYIEERFPEIVNRTVMLDEPVSVVKGARLFYEDEALPRAVELLQFAIEDNPGEVKYWLALFEIFRLERLTGEFGALAKRFQAQHGESESWPKVKYFGREIDPGNTLYEESSNTLETIGPSEARRVSAATANFDPIAENWLNAPMDFQNEVLANELRKALMVQASLSEQDLVPNPMPALRNVEMFTVA